MIKFLMKHQGRAFSPNRRGFTEGVGSTNRLPLLGLKVGAISSISLSCFYSGLKFFVQLLFYTFTSVRCWAEVRAEGT